MDTARWRKQRCRIDIAREPARDSLEKQMTEDGFRVRRVELQDGQDPLSTSPADLARLFAATPPVGEKWQKKYRKLSGAAGKLKVWVSVADAERKAEATVDLYSSRSRRQEALTLARRLDLEPDELEQGMLTTFLREATADPRQISGRPARPVFLKGAKCAPAAVHQPAVLTRGLRALNRPGQDFQPEFP